MGMTIGAAARKWNLSPNWVRALIKRGTVKAVLRKDIPVPFYEIAAGTPKPASTARWPARANSNKKRPPQSASMDRRDVPRVTKRKAR